MLYWKKGINFNKKEGDNSTPKGLFNLRKLYFDKIQDFQTETTLKELYELTNRSVYNGQYNFHSKGEYVKALQKFLGDRYPEDDDWIDKVLYRPDHNELDRGEWV